MDMRKRLKDESLSFKRFLPLTLPLQCWVMVFNITALCTVTERVQGFSFFMTFQAGRKSIEQSIELVQNYDRDGHEPPRFLSAV